MLSQKSHLTAQRCLSRQFHVQLWQCIIFQPEFNIFPAIESVGLCSKNRVLCFWESPLTGYYAQDYARLEV